MTTKVLNGLDMQSTTLTGVPNGVNPSDAINKSQLDAAVQGYSWKQPVRAASTANLTLSGAQTIDTVAVIVGDRVLVKNQTAATANGIYVCAAGAWARATDMDVASEFLLATCFVSEGSQGNTSWLMTTDAPIVVGTTNIVWAQTGGGTAYTAGNGLTLTGAVFEVDTTVVARKASATIGDGTSTTLTVTHNLNTLDVVCYLRDATSNAAVETDMTNATVNTVQFTFATAPTTGQYRATVIG